MKSSDNKTDKSFLSRPRIVMGGLLMVALPIFVYLADKAVQENAQAIRQFLGQ